MNTVSPALHSAAHLLTLHVIESLVVGSMIGLSAMLVLRLARHEASTRFAVWFCSLMAMAVVPFISGSLWQLQSNTQSRAAITLPDSFAIYLFGIWAVVAAWSLFGVVRSIWHLRQIRQSCTEIDIEKLPAQIRETIFRRRADRKVALCASAEVRVPTAIGLFRPAVVFPEWAMNELSTEELTQVLLHELAHLRRWDDWTNLALQLVKAIFFFHPIVWWMERNATLERELACDDAVLAETENPRSYAQCLAHLAEKSFVQRSMAMAQAALGSIHQMTERVSRILHGRRPAVHSRALKPVVACMSVFAVACGVWSGRVSRLIAFEDGAPTLNASRTAGRSTWDNPADSVAKIVPAMVRESNRPGITAAKLKFGSALKTRANAPANARANDGPVHPSVSLAPTNSNHLVHLTSLRVQSVPVTETVFVLVQTPNWNSAISESYQIQVWHLVILRTTQNPATTQVPRKEI